jgi:predicted ATP-dependent serine protease
MVDVSTYQIRLFGWIAKRWLAHQPIDAALTTQLPTAWRKMFRTSNSKPGDRLRLLMSTLDSLESEQRDALAVSTLNASSAETPPNPSINLNDVAAIFQGVEWLWKDWIPFGMVTLLIAEPGVGKSAFVLGGLAPAITVGHQFPDGQTGFEIVGPVIWCDTESAHAMTIERAVLWKLPNDKILLPGDDPLESISIDNEEHLKQLKAQIIRERVKLVVIDSLRSAHAGEENCSRDAVLTMKKLAHIAQSTNCAILVVHHTRKIRDGQSVNSNSSRGSNAITAMARSVIALSKPDPNDDTVLVQVVKSNVGKYPAPLGFRIESEGISCCEPPAELQRSSRPSQFEAAKAFLSECLADGPQSHSRIEQLAGEQGIATTTLKRAKSELGIDSKKEKSGWIWSLPQGR